MNTAVLSEFKQPMAFTWHEEDGQDLHNLTAVEVALYENRIQIAALNKRVDQLTKELKGIKAKENHQKFAEFLTL